MSSLDNLTKEQVVGDVIDTQPSASIKVKWPSGAVAEQGNKLTPTQVKDQPKFEFQAKPDKLYTLAMVDPDAPSREEHTLREILHFMVANIPGDDVSKGDTFAEYIGSGAPQGTGFHRYIFLLFEQQGKLNSDLMKIRKTSRVGRTKFSIRNFAKEHNLGNPVAANFFQAEYDDYVPKLRAQLSSG
jgi:phosphatidylethanolamine-binding protein (PEBP) family uncharacterized protein